VDSWRYQVGWKPAILGGSSVVAGNWLVVAPARRRRHHPQWTQLLRCHGHHSGRFGPTRPATLASGSAHSTSSPTTWCRCWPWPIPRTPTANGSGPDGALVQALGDATSGRACGASRAALCPPGRWDRLTDIDQASIWGLVGPRPSNSRPLGGLVDNPRRARRPRHRTAGVGAGRSRRRRGPGRGPRQRRVVRRLARAVKSATEQERWQPRGTVLTTGGTGALGSQVANVGRRKRRRDVVVVSRQGADAPGAGELEPNCRTRRAGERAGLRCRPT